MSNELRLEDIGLDKKTTPFIEEILSLVNGQCDSLDGTTTPGDGSADPHRYLNINRR